MILATYRGYAKGPIGATIRDLCGFRVEGFRPDSEVVLPRPTPASIGWFFSGILRRLNSSPIWALTAPPKNPVLASWNFA